MCCCFYVLIILWTAKLQIFFFNSRIHKLCTNMFDVNIIVVSLEPSRRKKNESTKQLKQNNRLSCQRARNFCGGSWKSHSMSEHFPAFPCSCVSFSQGNEIIQTLRSLWEIWDMVFWFSVFCFVIILPFLFCCVFCSFAACQIWNIVVKNIDSRLLSSVEPTNNIVVAVVCRWWRCMIWASNRQHSMIFQKKSSVVYFWAIALESSLCTLNFIA